MELPDESNEYDFFKEFDSYRAKEEGIETSALVKNYADGCEFITKDSILKDINSINTVCEHFKFLYNKLISVLSSDSSKSYENKDASFMNYWLNIQFQKYNMNTTDNIKRFYNELISKDKNFDKTKILDNKLQKIDDNELNNMKELYALYKESNKIYIYLTSEKEEGCTSCSMCTEMCIEKYKKNIKRCLNNNTKFCKALYKFKELYEGYFDEDHMNRCSVDLQKLPSYYDVTDMLSAAEQKFTPFRQWLHSKIRRKDKIPSYEHAMTSNLLPYINHTSNQDFDNKAYNIQYKSVGKQ
ncbi:VIR protein [Plasmodium vivax]|uniref:VIR protein n=1 Tax=Plasmodium vivax TaxID=5855 RepID=A0A1G4HI38_PLAVI|nr:VIR protein [Plasmodium vivax]